MLAYLGLGSNDGDREMNLRRAVSMVGELPATRVEKCSSLLPNKAEGFDGNDFLNMCMAVQTSLSAEDLLRSLKDVERTLGRKDSAPKYDADGQRIYHNRCIDIDILLYGEEKIDTDILQVPHPRMREREFVMTPLREICPNIDEILNKL